MRHIIIFSILALFLTIPAIAQNVSLAWDLSVDDAMLGAGGGYKIYQSKQSMTYTSTAIATVAPGVSTVTFSTGQLGKLYWVATAFAADGTESIYSNEVTSTIKPKPPKLNTITQVALAIKNTIVKITGIFRSNSRNLRIISYAS